MAVNWGNRVDVSVRVGKEEKVDWVNLDDHPMDGSGENMVTVTVRTICGDYQIKIDPFGLLIVETTDTEYPADQLRLKTHGAKNALGKRILSRVIVYPAET